MSLKREYTSEEIEALVRESMGEEDTEDIDTDTEESQEQPAQGKDNKPRTVKRPRGRR